MVISSSTCCTLQLRQMADLPPVSIITPSYNQAAFLEQTICSILGQSYPRIEYMLVDGGSSDGSVEIIQRYAHRLAWWVSERDSGQAEAINKGLRRASGEIVAWLNSDDLYLPGAVAQAVAAFQADPSLGLVYGDAITIDAHGKPLGRFAFGDWSLLDLAGFRIICQPAVFMRRSVLERAGYLEPSFHFMLDHHLWIRMARLAPVRHVASTSGPEPVLGLWAAARHHPGAKNVSQAAGFGRETLEVLEWMKTQPDLAALIQRNHRRVLLERPAKPAFVRPETRPSHSLRLAVPFWAEAHDRSAGQPAGEPPEEGSGGCPPPDPDSVGAARHPTAGRARTSGGLAGDRFEWLSPR